MAKERPTEKELDTATVKTLLARKLIRASRATAQMMGVAPAAWMLALIEEMAAVIMVQMDAGETVEAGLELVIGLLMETVRDRQSNPRIGEEEESIGISMRIVETPTVTGPREPDMVNELIARTIGRAER